MNKKGALLLLGGGYCLTRLAAQLQDRTVYISSRTEEGCARLQSSGATPVLLDLASDASIHSFFSTERYIEQIVDSVPPFEDFYRERLETFVERAEKHGCKRFVYLGTTGVFGVTDGSRVDEQTSCTPMTESARQRLQAEQVYQNSDVASIVLRLSGIYGPGRSPATRITRGLYPADCSLDKWTNRIHVDDIVALLKSIISKVPSGQDADHRVYVVSDDKPLKLGEVFRLYQELCGIERTIDESRTVSEAARARLTLNQRVRNERMKHELLPTLHYPTLEHAIRDPSSGAQ